MTENEVSTQGRMSNTYLTYSLNICIDWFSYTADQEIRVKRGESDIHAVIQFILPILKILKVDPNAYTKGIGKAFYKYRLTYDEVFIFFFDGPSKDPLERMHSFMFEMSGKACRRFDEKYPLNSTEHWYELGKVLMDYTNFNITRIDTPIDDYSGKLMHYKYFMDKVEKGEVQCTAGYYMITKKNIMYDNYPLGHSMKIGSTSSGRMLMVYDKKLERESDGYITLHNYWYRYELRTKNDSSCRGTRLFFTLMEHEFKLNEVVPGLFMDYIRLLEPSNETKHNKSRIQTDPIWEEFLQTSSKVKLENQIISERTIKSKSKWITKAVAKAMMLLKFSEDDYTLTNFEKFNTILAIDKMENIDLDAINSYRFNSGRSKLSKYDLEKERDRLADELQISKNKEGIYVYYDGSPVEYYKK